MTSSSEGGASATKSHGALFANEHAVGDDAMEMHVEIQRAAKALHERDCSRLRSASACTARAAALAGEYLPQCDIERARDQPGVAREEEARPAR